jgi:hypothetical protein
MLEMRAACEKCSTPLTNGGDAPICIFECTFCMPCGETMNRICPNCGAELT